MANWSLSSLFSLISNSFGSDLNVGEGMEGGMQKQLVEGHFVKWIGKENITSTVP